MKINQKLLAVGAFALAAASASATPYASEVTNSSGTVSFYLNEAPNSVVVTFEDSSTLSVPSPVVGSNSFSLGSHTTYSIAVNKVGAGSPSQLSQDTNPYCLWPSLRGLAVNVNPTSPNLMGRIYIGTSGAGSGKQKGLYVLNADESSLLGSTNGLGASIFSGSSTSGPYRITLGRDDNNLYCDDLSSAHAGLYQFDPNITIAGNQVLFGVGSAAGQAAGVHGELVGAPKVLGSSAAGNLVVWTTDYNMAVNAGGGNSTLGYSTLAGNFNTLNKYVIGSNAFPWNHYPDLAITAQVPSVATLVEDVDIGKVTGNIYDGNFRANYGAPDLQIFDPTGMNLLFSSQTSGSSDYFNIAEVAYNGSGSNGLIPAGTMSSIAAGTVAPYCMSVSPDEKYVACGIVDDTIMVMSIVGGVPDPTTLQTIYVYPNDTVNGENTRGICWDLGDNIYTISSGTGLLRVFSLGLTTTATTANNAAGTAGAFSLSTPSVTASVTTPTGVAYQANNSYAGNGPTPTATTYTITLNASQTGSTVVGFNLLGTATNGVNYTLTNNGTQITGSSASVTFPAGITSETITLTPTASPVSGPTLSAILSLTGSAGYSTASPSSATVLIVNSGPQVVFISGASAPTMYRGTAGDYTVFQLGRYGDTNVAFTVPASSLANTGTAVAGTDYTLIDSVGSFASGATTESVTNGNPVSTPYPYTYVGNKSIIVTVSGGTSPESIPFTVTGTTSSTTTLLDNGNPPETRLFADSLADPSDTGWNLAFGSVATPLTVVSNYLSVAGNGSTTNTDYDVEFGYTLANDPLIAVLPPNGSNSALKVTVNKVAVTYTNGSGTNVVTVTQGATGGVSLYPALAAGLPRKFTGNYAFRFSELSYEDAGGFGTEYANWGINHYGTNANWWAGSFSGGFGNPNIDGIWWSTSSDQGGASFGDIAEFVTTNFPNTGYNLIGTKSESGFSGVFKNPPYTSSGLGSPAVGYGNTGNIWNDVEIKQFNNVITYSINKTPIFTYTNTVGFVTNGDVMLGYCDPFDSVGTYGEVYYSDARVVSLAGPVITSVKPGSTSTSLVITFTSPDTDAVPASFAVMSSTNVNGTYSAAVTSTITQTNAVFTALATVSTNVPANYYVIKQTDLIH